MIFSNFKLLLFTLAGVVLLFVVVFWGGSYFLPTINLNTVDDTDAQTSEVLLVGKKAPYFDLPDILGNHVRLDEFLNAPVLIVFWSTWSSAAADQLKILDDYNTTHEQLIKIVAIDSQEERSVASSFVRRGGYKVQILVDALGATSDEYRIKSLPTLYFLDQDGVVKDTHVGVLSAKELGDKIEQLLR